MKIKLNDGEIKEAVKAWVKARFGFSVELHQIVLPSREANNFETSIDTTIAEKADFKHSAVVK